MRCTVYISYSMSDSSKAYDLSGQLSKQKITYNLDCIESGYNLSDYTKQNIEECKVYVALVGVRYAESKYALDTLHHAINHGKHIIVCPLEGTPLPETMATYTTAEESNLLATLTRAAHRSENKDGGPGQAIYENALHHIDKEDNVNENKEYIDEEEYIDKEYIIEEEAEEEKSPVFSIQQPEITFPSVSTLGSWTVYNDSHDTTTPASSKELQEDPKEEQQEVAPYIETRGKWEPDNAKTSRVPTIEEVIAAEKYVKKYQKPDAISLESSVIIAFLVIFVPIIISLISGGYNKDKATTNNVQPEKTRIELHYEKISNEDILEGKQLNAIGLQYMNGTNEKDKNPAKALENFEKAAKLGNVNAMYNAGICYIMANRKKQDLEELNMGAMHLYEATEAGHDKSLEKLKEIADMNIAYAQALLGKCYQMGYGTFTDHSQAFLWFMKAVENGSSLGMYHLAWYYLYGKGVISVDLKVAHELYLQAESLGLKAAQGKADMVKAMMEKAENSTHHTPTTPH